ncbi:MAG: hypothetical protein EBT79_06430 [Actinobacteria bacterium]|nr:hypothetical protein [Actinomycetota bacterium]
MTEETPCPECKGKCCRNDYGYRVEHMGAESYEHVCECCHDGTFDIPWFHKDFATVPTIEPVPTSCHCGGDTAWVARRGDVLTMLGCVCHTEVHVSRHRDGWRVMSRRKKNDSVKP